MQMSVGDIKRSYDEAKNKKTQIGILAELNCCTKEEIVKIIDAENRRKESLRETSETPREEPKLSQIKEMLYARLDELEKDIKALEEEYRKVSIAAEVLANMKEVIGS